MNTEKMKVIKKSDVETATEEKEKESKVNQQINKDDLAACNRELIALLDKYNCRLTAQVIVGENKIVPQIFVVNATS